MARPQGKAALGSSTASQLGVGRGAVTVSVFRTPTKVVRKTVQIRLANGNYMTLHNTPTDVTIAGGIPVWEKLERPGKRAITRRGSTGLREMSFSNQIVGRHNESISSKVKKIKNLVSKGEKVRLRNIDPTIESDIWWVIDTFDVKVVKRRSDQQINAVELSWKLTEFNDQTATLKKITPPPKPKPKTPKGKTITYTVKRGDTLWAIAKKHLGNPLRWKEIYKLNRSRNLGRRTGKVTRAKEKNKIYDAHWIFPGQRIKIRK